MRERATVLYPFAIAIVLPPAGVVLGVAAMSGEDRDNGFRIVIVAVLAALVWGAVIASSM